MGYCFKSAFFFICGGLAKNDMFNVILDVFGFPLKTQNPCQDLKSPCCMLGELTCLLA